MTTFDQQGLLLVGFEVSRGLGLGYARGRFERNANVDGGARRKPGQRSVGSVPKENRLLGCSTPRAVVVAAVHRLDRKPMTEFNPSCSGNGHHGPRHGGLKPIKPRLTKAQREA